MYLVLLQLYREVRNECFVANLFARNDFRDILTSFIEREKDSVILDDTIGEFNGLL